MITVELTDAVTCETNAVNLDDVTQILTIAFEPATTARLTLELVHETIDEIIGLCPISPGA